MIMKRVLSAAVGGLAVIAISGSVLAGFKELEQVRISSVATRKTASGAVGSARNSADSVQYIECTVQSFSNGSGAVFCAARDAAGNSFSCTASANPAMATAVAAIGTGTRLFIGADNGACTQIDATNGSSYRPATP